MANAAYDVPPRAQNSTPTVYNPIDIKNRNAKSDDITRLIESILLADKYACYSDMEKYLIPPGVCGSKQFDQGRAVLVLLSHDKKQKGYISEIMETRGMSERMLWDMLQKTLRRIGFKLKLGRIVGFMEGPKPDDADENEEPGVGGQPDVD